MRNSNYNVLDNHNHNNYSYYIILHVGIKDFDNETLTLGFYGSVDCHRARIHIINDDINEAKKEIFNIQLTLDYSHNPNLITLFRNVSLGIIIDDDRKLGNLICIPKTTH